MQRYTFVEKNPNLCAKTRRDTQKTRKLLFTRLEPSKNPNFEKKRFLSEKSHRAKKGASTRTSTFFKPKSVMKVSEGVPILAKRFVSAEK